ncbi:MAG: PPC domain-containing protein [Planctomycetes bacterium]|nr:PPC domain-containing protein [Planctomycetota bacterium]
MKVWVNAKGISIKPAKEAGKFTVTIAADVPPGTYWMRLVNDEGVSEQRPFLVGTLPEVLEVDPNDDSRMPQVLAEANVVVNGRLNPVSDIDHFAVDLKKGQTLVASLQANSVLRSPMDGMLQVLSADGYVLAENNDFHGLDPQIAYSVPKDGRYLVRVFSFPAVADSSIRFFGSETCVYRLTLTTGGFAEHAFPLAVSLKDPSPVGLSGWNIPDAAKNIVVMPEQFSSRLPVRHPSVTNPGFIRVEPHPCIEEVEPNDRAHAQLVETPVTISGRIGRPRDIDAYSFVLKKGDKRLIKVEASALGSQLDPVLEVFDTTGKAFKEVDDVGALPDPEFSFAVTIEGTYRIEIRDRYLHGGESYFYRVRITNPEPDFSVALAADQFSITPGETLEIPFTATRLNGLTQAIDLRAVDLPKGVECELIKVDAAAKMLKLKLTAKKDAVSGPFRIEGTAGFTRAARFDIVPFGTSTETFWLTVGTPKK